MWLGQAREPCAVARTCHMAAARTECGAGAAAISSTLPMCNFIKLKACGGGCKIDRRETLKIVYYEIFFLFTGMIA